MRAPLMQTLTVLKCSTFLKRLMTLGSIGLLYGCASTEMVRVPVSDSTPPTTDMTVIVEFANGAPSQTINLSQNSSAPAIVHLQRFGDAVSVIATGTDRDGGIKNIEIVPNISTSYIDPNGNGVSISPLFARIDNPSNAQIGEDASIQRTASYVYEIPDPRTIVPAGSRDFRITGELYAQSKNFHQGLARTPVFRFVYQ